jgi:hypothetical protein
MDFPLVRELDGDVWRPARVPPVALRWLVEVERIFPGATKDIILVRPNSLPPREGEIGNSKSREKVKA